MQLTGQQIEKFQQTILSWYDSHQRDLPWRKTRDPYAILLSEVMSQQTQISRVVPKYLRWLKELPTVHVLADAPLSHVLQLWSGLGYNRRALFLQKTAHAIVHEYHGVWPTDVDALKKLPGLGPYTASAVACFAFDQQIAVIDTNIRKVILVTFFNQHLTEGQEVVSEKAISEIAKAILPAGKAYAWNQALMDYAASELKQHKIPLPKQSKLFGSNRYYRGQILKVLVQENVTTKEALRAFFVGEKAMIEEERLEKIIAGLVNEGLVKRIENKLFF